MKLKDFEGKCIASTEMRNYGLTLTFTDGTALNIEAIWPSRVRLEIKACVTKEVIQKVEETVDILD